MRIQRFLPSLIMAILSLSLPHNAYALCSNNEDGVPGESGQIEYFASDNALRYCDDVNWIDMSEATVPTISVGLTGYWKLDENSGTDIADSGSLGRDGTSYNMTLSTASQAGVNGRALSFNGSDNYIETTLTSRTVVQNIGPDNLTIAAWFKADTTSGARRIVALPHNATDGYEGISLLVNNNKIQGSLGLWLGGWHNDYILETAFTDTTAWHHIAMTYDGNVIRLYLDAVEVDSVTQAGDIDQSDDLMRIGSFSSTYPQYFDGMIDEVRIYNYPLSAAELSVLIGATTPNLELAGHWRLDEASGTAAYDASGNDNHGTLAGGMNASSATTVGKVGSAMNFNGSSNYISIANESNFDFERTNPLSISAWIYRNDNSTEDDIIEKVTPVSFRGFGLWMPPGSDNVRFFMTSDLGTGNYFDTETDSDVLVPQEWHHVVVTYDGSNDNSGVKIYVNGVAQSLNLGGVNNLTGSILNNYPVLIGADVAGDTCCLFNGKIDDVRIYHKELSASEVTAVYEESEADPVGHWKFDETSGTTVNDSSSYGNNGAYTVNASRIGVSGVLNTAFLPQNNEYVEIPNDPSFVNTTKITVSAWIQGTASGSGNLLFQDDYFSVTSNNSNQRVQYSFFRYDGSGGSWRTDDNVLIAGGWNHIAITHDFGSPSNDPALYVNGVAVPFSYETSTPSGNLTLPTGNLFIGNKPPADQLSSTDWNGKIDEIRIYNKLLSEEEIVALYEEGEGDLVGYWKLDETSGTTAIDSSGYDNNGAMSGSLSGANSVTGKVGTALTFDGNGIINLGSSITINSVPFTTCLWAIRTGDGDSNHWQEMVGNSSFLNTGWNINFEPEDTTVAFILNRAGNRTVVSHPVDNTQWNHYCGVYDGTTAYLYVNGEMVASAVTTMGWAARNIYIGDSGDGSNGASIDGVIDDVRIYKRALEAWEIAVMATCTRPGTFYYNFANDAMQWCNGVNSAVNMATPASGVGGCTFPPANQGSLIYESERYKFCDGNGWVDIGK